MMTRVLIRYRVKPERVREHLGLLGAVFDELAASRPDGLRWDSYQLEDGVSFADVAAVDAPGTLSRLESWAAYRTTLEERCDDPPVLTNLERIGSYASDDHPG